MSQSFASERLHAISVRMKAQGMSGMHRQMARTMRGAVKPLVTAVGAAARQQLPKSGGLNELVAGRHTTVSVMTAGARTAGVRMRRARKDSASYQTDRGYVFHKTFGEEPWKQEPLPQAAGWWSTTLAQRSPAVTPVLVAEMNRVARKIQGY